MFLLMKKDNAYIYNLLALAALSFSVAIYQVMISVIHVKKSLIDYWI